MERDRLLRECDVFHKEISEIISENYDLGIKMFHNEKRLKEIHREMEKLRIKWDSLRETEIKCL